MTSAEGAIPAHGADGAKPAGGQDDDREPPTSQVPDQYVLKVPEARAAFVDREDLTFLEDVARERNWSNADAQAALDEHVARVMAQTQRFKAETLADKEYGGDHFPDTERLGRAVIDRFRPAGHPRRESFLRFLNRGGAGSHVEVVSFLADLGDAMAEDAPAHGRSTPADSGQSAAEKFYDHPTSRARG